MIAGFKEVKVSRGNAFRRCAVNNNRVNHVCLLSEGFEFLSADILQLGFHQLSVIGNINT